ncbi:MAG: acyltransferase family protein [Anaerolineales bacterium]
MDTKTVQRRYDLDWLRVLAFTAVFFYHCGRFFDGGDWHIKNGTTSALVDTLKGIFDLWGMPLIFLISGASIFFALRPGGALRFLRARVLRLLVPLAFGILVLGPPQIYLERLTHGEFQGSFLEFLPLYYRDWRVFVGTFAWSVVHLWYLEYLLLFTLVLLPLFAALKRPTGQRMTGFLARLSALPGAIFLWVLPAVLLIILGDPYGLMRPGPTEDVGRLFFAPFVIYGFLVFSDLRIQQAIIRQRRIALVLAVPLVLAMPGIAGLLEDDPSFLIYALGILLVGVLMWSCILTVLGYGMRYLTANHRLLAYANEGVLPFYVLHQPVILILGYFIIALPLSILTKYLIIAPLAFAIALGLYEVGVRRMNPVRQVFGLKARKPVPPAVDLLAQPLS